MDSITSQSSSKSVPIRKRMMETVAELTAPGKILIQLDGWRNICQTLEYIFVNCPELFDKISGISFHFEGLCQVVGNICTAENLKNKVLFGETLTITSSSLKLDMIRNVDLLEGFDDLDRLLKKLNIWGCSFVILQVKLDYSKSFGARRIPFDNSEYFGIFSSSVQALGMVPILQLQYQMLGCGEEPSTTAFVDTMYSINQSLFDFEVDPDCLLISPLVSYSLEEVKEDLTSKAEALINSLKHSLPPAIGGVIFSSEGSYKAFSLLLDQLSKIISRIPWPLCCCYQCKVPSVLDSDMRSLIFEKWAKKQRKVLKVLSLASESNLIPWKGKLTIDLPDFITTHDYYDKEYEEAMMTPPPGV